MKALRTGLLVMLALLMVVIGVVAYQALSGPGLDREALARDGVVLLPEPRTLPDLTLTDQRGQPFTLGQPNGQWTLVFFGYTFCPDICPTTLADLRKVLQQLPDEARARTRVLMVTVDPARDTPARLKEYLAYFDPGFIGLTGNLQQVQALSNAVGVPFIPADTSRENYTVDHSGNLAIINPNGALQGFVRAPLQVDKLAERLPQLVAAGAP